TFKYVGSQSVDLNGVSRAEQHFFVAADPVGHVSRIYWIQFEAYLPNNVLSYQYPISKVVTLGGLDFIADTFTRSGVSPEKSNPESDLGRAESFLHNRDYWMDPESFILQRFVHLPTPDHRQELMIVYGEDVGEAQVEEVSGPDVAKDAPVWETLSES